MTAFIAKRVGLGFIVLFCVSLLAFLLIHLVPGDPAQILAGPRASPETIDRLRESLGLGGPLTSQYLDFVKGLVTGDLGTSISRGLPVSELVKERVGPSALLIGYSLLIALALAIPLAVIAARRTNTVADDLVRGFSTVTFVMPPFWVGVLLVLAFSVKIRIFPSSGYGDGFLEHVRSLTLPSLTIAMFLAPILVRTLRASLLESLSSDYVMAANARGLSRRRVMYKHALRNSLVSTITVLGLLTGLQLSATVVVENVFAIPGLGSLLITSVNMRDFPTVQALVVIFGAAVLVVNLLTDVAYAAIDPRIRL